MTSVQRKGAFTFVGLTLFVAVIAVFALQRDIEFSEEANVYYDFFSPDPNVIEFKGGYVLSAPSICDSSNVHYANMPTTAIKNFLEKNKANSKPIRLKKLEGSIPIFSWQDTKALHEDKLINFMNTEEKVLLKLSRVGFNNEKDKAVFCTELIEPGFSESTLFYMYKSDKKWIVMSQKTIRVS